MLDLPGVDPEDAPVLLEPTAAGRVLDLSPSRVRALADEGKLPVAARTERGLRLFQRRDVERLRDERAARRAPVQPDGDEAA